VQLATQAAMQARQQIALHATQKTITIQQTPAIQPQELKLSAKIATVQVHGYHPRLTILTQALN